MTEQFQIGDRVRRVRGGRFRDMNEGDEGVITGFRDSTAREPMIELEGHGDYGFTYANYIFVSRPGYNPASVRTFKVGDKVFIARMSSGVHSWLGKDVTVTSVHLDGPNPYVMVRQEGSATLIGVYTKDLEFIKPLIDISNFKNYMKSKIAANVAAV